MTAPQNPRVTQVDRNRAHELIAALGLTSVITSWKHPYNAFARHREAAEAASKAREAALVEALEVAWAEAHKLRNAAKLVGPYPNDPKANRLWARSLYHAGKDLCAKLKPYRAAITKEPDA